MERELKDIADEVPQHPKVVGYLCVDSNNGLCLAADGIANEKTSGVIANIAQLANKLEPGKSPVVYIESDKSKILIQSKDSVTTAIYKSMS